MKNYQKNLRYEVSHNLGILHRAMGNIHGAAHEHPQRFKNNGVYVSHPKNKINKNL